MSFKVKKINILISLIVISTLMPFINIFPTYTIQALCMLAAALYIALPVLRTFRFTRTSFILLTFFAGWLIFSASGFSEKRISTYVSLISFMLWGISASAIEYSEKYPEWMIKATGMISAFATIFFAYNKGAYANFARSIYPEDAGMLIQDNLIGNIAGLYNHYSKNGMILAISTGILFVSYLYSNNVNKKRRNLIMLLVCAAALLFSGKRGPVIFTAMSALICYAISLGKNFSIRKALKIASLVMGVVIGFFVISNYVPQLARFLQRFEEAEAAGSIMMGRDIYFDYAISMFLSKPLTGHGWYSFGAVFGQNVHNVYLQLLAETGVLGFFFFIIAFTYFLYVAVMEYRRAQFSGNMFGSCQILKAIYIILFFVLYGFTGNPLYDTLTLCPFFMAICIIRFYQENSIKLDCVSDRG